MDQRQRCPRVLTLRRHANEPLIGPERLSYAAQRAVGRMHPNTTVVERVKLAYELVFDMLFTVQHGNQPAVRPKQDAHPSRAALWAVWSSVARDENCARVVHLDRRKRVLVAFCVCVFAFRLKSLALWRLRFALCGRLAVALCVVLFAFRGACVLRSLAF